MSTRIILIPAFSLPLFPSHLPFFLTFSKEGRSREFVQLSTRFQTRRDFSRLFSFEGKYAFSLLSSFLLASCLQFRGLKREGGRGRRERRCNYLFQRNLFEIFAGRDCCSGVIGKMGLMMDDSRRWCGNVSFSLRYGLSREIVDLYFLIIIFSYHNFDNFVNSYTKTLNYFR